MVVYTIHHEVITQKYRAHVCSFATIFSICVWAIIILSPIFLAYHSLGLWLKESSYREQPEVHYKHRFILLLQGTTLNSLLGYSTDPNFNQRLGENVRIPIIKSFEVDSNYDGKKDYLSFNIQVPLLNTEVIHSVKLILFFDYKLHRYASVQMESLAYIHYESASSGEELSTDGKLKFQQTYPLPHRGSYTKFESSILQESVSANSDDGYNLQNIFRTYQSRNITTDFIGRYPVWKIGQSGSFTVKGKVHYPEETIIYHPGVWQLLKFAWIQYLAILVIFLYVLGRVKSFVYENQIVNTIPQKVHLD